MAFYGGRKLIMNFLIGSFNNIVSHLAYRQLDNRSLSYKLNDDTAALLVEWKLLYGGDSGRGGYLQLLRSAIDRFCAAKTQSEDATLHLYRISKCVCRLSVACVERVRLF
jgi:hypothetical protein